MNGTKQTLSMTAARDQLYRDKKQAEEVDDAGVQIACYYAHCRMVLWTKTVLHWRREVYLDDRLADTRLYA